MIQPTLSETECEVVENPICTAKQRTQHTTVNLLVNKKAHCLSQGCGLWFV